MADSPYQTIVPLVGTLPSWVSDKRDQERLASYDLYDDMYHNNPDTYALMLRGIDEDPILVPTAKSVIKNMSRYVGRGFGFAVPREQQGTEAQQTLAITAYGELFKREQILSKFKSATKQLLRRGDVFWYIQADSNKPAGSRISIDTVDPRNVFKITAYEEPNRVTGYMMVEQFQTEDKLAVKKQMWLKNTNPDHPNYGNPEAPCTYECETIEADGWDGDNPKIIQKLVPQMYLPVVQLPIYHLRNDAEDEIYGSSELRGLERVIAAINQGASDQDIALAMAGLGMYKSNSGGPVGDDGSTESDWIIGPGRVIEDESFERVDGVGSIQPSLDHIAYLERKIDSTVGVTDVTRGEVTAEVAESGVALAIRMAPTVDMAEEKDTVIKDVWDHILFDLKAWFKALEGIDLTGVEIVTAFGDKMPRNRDAELKELHELLAAKIISVEYFQHLLNEKFGYKLPADINNQIANDTAKASAAADPFGARMEDEAGADPSAPPADEEV
ncbi:portal protein [Arthrobacter phage Wollypog]|uniref:Portal protein n=1 Tax=Arthrobacter phage Wollypog TaxID=2790985 RepID=A0A7T3KD39_9CAUD|nr:portal protein [Arthrobacter phage Wollypog]QPX62555.1 portal protein [Arthrobacter phage Wollypog]